MSHDFLLIVLLPRNFLNRYAATSSNDHNNNCRNEASSDHGPVERRYAALEVCEGNNSDEEDVSIRTLRRATGNGKSTPFFSNLNFIAVSPSANLHNYFGAEGSYHPFGPP
jgi:hypothetical protein